jgi:hypothetical protein
MDSYHLRPVIAEITKDGVKEIPVKLKPREVGPAEFLWIAVIRHFTLVPATWAKDGNTGYLDQQRLEDFPAGEDVVQGVDVHGRAFISFRYRTAGFDDDEKNDEARVMTVFTRYEGGQGPWVTGGDTKPFRVIVEGKVYPNGTVESVPFVGGCSGKAFDILGELLMGKCVKVFEYDRKGEAKRPFHIVLDSWMDRFKAGECPAQKRGAA